MARSFPLLSVEFHLLVAIAEGGPLPRSLTLPGARQVRLETCPDRHRLPQVTGHAPALAERQQRRRNPAGRRLRR